MKLIATKTNLPELCKKPRNSQRVKRFNGFVMGPILFFIALVAMITGGMAVINRESSSYSANESRSKLSASLIQKQAADLKQGFNAAVASGQQPANIVLDTGISGLYNPSLGFAVKPTIPEGSCNSNNCQWQLNKNLKISQITGSSGNFSRVSDNQGCVKKDQIFTFYDLAMSGPSKDIVFVLPGLKPEVCEELIKEVNPSFIVDGQGTSIPATPIVFVPGSSGGAGYATNYSAHGRCGDCVTVQKMADWPHNQPLYSLNRIEPDGACYVNGPYGVYGPIYPNPAQCN